MDWDYIEGNWKQLKGNVRERWGKLTDDDLEKIAGKRDRLMGTLQEKYSESKADLEKQVNDWKQRLQ